MAPSGPGSISRRFRVRTRAISATIPITGCISILSNAAGRMAAQSLVVLVDVGVAEYLPCVWHRRRWHRRQGRFIKAWRSVASPAPLRLHSPDKAAWGFEPLMRSSCRLRNAVQGWRSRLTKPTQMTPSSIPLQISDPSKQSAPKRTRYRYAMISRYTRFDKPNMAAFARSPFFRSWITICRTAPTTCPATLRESARSGGI